MTDRNADELIQATHPGFTITCNRCGSTRVIVDNTLGSSAESGAWGSIDLVCQGCGQTREIVST